MSLLAIEQINFSKDGLGRLYTNNSFSGNSERKYRSGEVSSISNQYFLIPQDKVWTINELGGGCNSDNVGCKITLFYAPLGTDQNLQFIESIYCNGSSDKKNIVYQSPVGDGTISLLLRRERLGTMEITASFYYNSTDSV